MERELTDKQKAFVREYLVDCNATAAAGRAGYSDANIGRQLITKNNVRAAINEAMEKRAEKTELTAEWVLEKLRKEAELTGEGASHSARIRAMELLGKHLGMFEDRLRVNQEGPVEIIIKRAAKKDDAHNGS